MGAVVGTLLAVAGTVGAVAGAAADAAAESLISLGILEVVTAESEVAPLVEIPLIMDGEEESLFSIFGYEGMLDGAANPASLSVGATAGYGLTGTGGAFLSGGAVAAVLGLIAGGTALGLSAPNLPKTGSNTVLDVLNGDLCTLYEYVVYGRCVNNGRSKRGRKMWLEDRSSGYSALPPVTS